MESHQLEQTQVGQKFPVAEIFGPTIQGEGIDQGVPCHFIRFGGCDYRCDWCDTPHAVLPRMVRAADRLAVGDIISRVRALAPGPEWIILSGGNPCLHELGALISALQHDEGYSISLETQGTRWKDWVKRCNRVAISPKPPSSGHNQDLLLLKPFLEDTRANRVFLKIVVFDNIDYLFAQSVHALYPDVPMFLSAGNDAGATVGNPDRIDTRDQQQVINDLLARGRWLANRTMVDPLMSDVRVQVQQHVLYWGNERGR